MLEAAVVSRDFEILENMSSELDQLVNLVAHEQKREQWTTETVN